MGVFMRDTDAFTWYMERDPILRSTVVAVAWLESSPDWEVLVARMDRATRLVPMLRHRVVEPPGRLATPRWTVDDRFDLTWHLRRVDSPAPHTADTVVALDFRLVPRHRGRWNDLRLQLRKTSYAAAMIVLGLIGLIGLGAAMLLPSRGVQRSP